MATLRAHALNPIPSDRLLRVLSPSCKLNVVLDRGEITPGQPVDGAVFIEAANAVTRIKGLEVTYVVTVKMREEKGDDVQNVAYVIHEVSAHFDVPDGVLAAGPHRVPFQLHAPRWLPPVVEARFCAVEHSIRARLDVDWAIDPKCSVKPDVTLAPVRARRAPVAFRTPVALHDRVELEIALASSTFAADEPLTGRIALRAGADVRFDAVVLAVKQLVAPLVGLQPIVDLGGLRIPSDALRDGDSFGFSIPSVGLLPSFRSHYMRCDAALFVSLDIPFARDPVCTFPLDVVPAGSTFSGDPVAASPRSASSRRKTDVLVRHTGFAEGAPPILVEGKIGAVSVRLVEERRGTWDGIDLEYRFEDLGLGTHFGHRVRASPDDLELPPALVESHVLTRESNPRLPAIGDAELATFYRAALTWPERDVSLGNIQLSDSQLSAHFDLMDDDDGTRVVPIAVHALEQARRLASEIARLPFPAQLAGARPAWESAATELGAVLIPTGPTLANLRIGVETFGGGEVIAFATIRTRYAETGIKTVVDVDLSLSPLPADEAASQRGRAASFLDAARATFPRTVVYGTSVAFERDGFTEDPKALLPALDAILGWVLEIRGERRAGAGYR